MEDITYLFIDGGYIRSIYAKYFTPIFGPQYRLDVSQFPGSFWAPRKTFYYDCIDTIQRHGETPAQTASRIGQQRDSFDEFRSLDGVHVTLGRLKRVRRRTVQKEVDVALAVDMLNHAVRHNMSRAVLIAGDSDFRPLVRSLLQFGTYVILASDPATTSRPLMRAADQHMCIDIRTLCRLTKLAEGVVRNNVFPTEHRTVTGDEHAIANGTPFTIMGSGTIAAGSSSLSVWRGTNTIRREFRIVRKSVIDWRVLSFTDADKLDKVVSQLYGLITWNP